jgi:hypothetical protein
MSCNLPLLGFAGAVVQTAATGNVPEMDIADLPDHSIRSTVQGDLSKADGIQYSC